MKPNIIALVILLFSIYSCYGIEQDCRYAGSNLEYVQSEIDKAKTQTTVELMRFHAYRALSAIDKSNQPLERCGCDDALTYITQANILLVQASKSTSTAGTKILLNEALAHIKGSLSALQAFSNNTSPYPARLLQVNAVNRAPNQPKTLIAKTSADLTKKALQLKIDEALIPYAASLNKTISTVNCKEALAFATRIFQHCEQQLLRSNLSEGKKYYNLRTKEITAKAIVKIGQCTDIIH